jgi:hypothetical protein
VEVGQGAVVEDQSTHAPFVLEDDEEKGDSVS